MRSLLPLLVCLPAQATTVAEAGGHHHHRHRGDLASLQDIGVDLIPEGFTPRYPFQPDTLPALHAPAHHARRDGICGANSHDCLDIGHPERCCGDDTYCYINKDSEPKCCPIGSNCVDDSYCPSQAFFCTSTLAATGIHTMTVTGAAAPATTPTVLQGCCQRACPQTSFYLCASSLGGNCCPYGSDCQAGGNCVSTKTSGVSPRQTLQRGGDCAADQIRCDDGNGCCDAAAQCTQFHGGAFCAAPTPKAAPQSTLSFEPTGKPGAEGASGGGGGGDGSSGRTIGLAVGLSLGLSLILGLLAWRLLCLRRSRTAFTDPGRPPMAISELGTGPSSTSDQTPLEMAIPPDRAELPVMHEPNGFDAEPVEIDSAEVSQADDELAGQSHVAD
ncbi:hypothetical protein ESCO_005022 [Escovopsis weberi]|uniref:Uncharacterized protein n=1 Tax=Escovopsis weberi TaxID=150374 RepID=A0A0M8N6D7_ESCWE|nr:hypothetical protein ESCO_005022 [Escovopsis weberi]